MNCFNFNFLFPLLDQQKKKQKRKAATNAQTLGKCTECATTNSQGDYYWRAHILEKHPATVKNCATCVEVVTHRQSAIDKEQWLNGSHVHNSGIYKCPLCIIFYKSLKDLQSHIISSHLTDWEIIIGSTAKDRIINGFDIQVKQEKQDEDEIVPCAFQNKHEEEEPVEKKPCLEFAGQ